MLKALDLPRTEKLAVITRAMSKWDLPQNMSSSQKFVEDLEKKWRGKVTLKNGLNEYVEQIMKNISRLLKHAEESAIDET
jgi:hypothetical protein